MITGIDAYTLQTRVAPSLLVLVPVFLFLACLFSVSLLDISSWATAVGALGLTVLLAQLGRDLGLRSQAHLWTEWGGAPTNLLLSLTRSDLEKVTTERFRANIQTLFPDLNLPDTILEKTNWPAANEVYTSCIRRLRELTRDKIKFPLIAAENINYGFRRNVYGLRWIGFGLSIISSCAIASLHGDFSASLELSRVNIFIYSMPKELIISIAGCWSMTLFWILIVRQRWVRRVADAYAERLLGAMDILIRG